MRTNVEIDDNLMRDALRATGLKTKRAVIEAGLRMLVRVKGQEEMLKLAGNARQVGLEPARIDAQAWRDIQPTLPELGIGRARRADPVAGGNDLY